MGALAERVGANLSLSWRWFGYWRRRYVWLRLFILLAVFAQPIYEVRKPLIRELVLIAINGIEAAKRGPYFEARAVQFQQKKQLQRSLLAYFDRNEDGRLDRAESQRLAKQTGLTRRQVTGSGLRVELNPLVEASHQVGLLSRTTTANDIRRGALGRALAEREREHEDLWREVGNELVIRHPGPRDYLRWETWKHGLLMFREETGYRMGPGVTQFFAGMRPTMFGDDPNMLPAPRWFGMLGWAAVLAAAAVAVRRFGVGEELARRFREDPELAAAPCPLCGVPTQDYGALAQHRAPRAWATAAVVGLLLVTISALSSASGWRALGFAQLTRSPLEGFLAGAPPRFLTNPLVVMVLVLGAGISRWVFWPREVHASHRRPLLRVVGFAVGVVLVVGLLSMTAASTMRTLEGPRRLILVAPGRHPRRASAPDRRHRRQARVRAASSEAKPAAKPARRGPVRGAAALERSAKRLRSGEGRRRRSEHRARRERSRRGERERGREATRGEGRLGR